MFTENPDGTLTERHYEDGTPLDVWHVGYGRDVEQRYKIIRDKSAPAPKKSARRSKKKN